MMRCPRCWKNINQKLGRVKYILCHECMEELN